MKSNYSRCYLGKRCVQKTTNNNVFKKYTLLVAISYNGLIGYTLFEKGGVNSDRMVVFLNKILQSKKKYLVIMDNAPAHKSKKIKKTIEDTGNLLKYTVLGETRLLRYPYKPKTNAIETWFSLLKHHIKDDKIGITFNHLSLNIKKSIRKINKNAYQNIFKYAYVQCPSVKNKKSRRSTWEKKPKLYK